MNFEELFAFESIEVQDDVFNHDDSHGAKLGTKADPGDVVDTEPDEGDKTVVKTSDDPEDTVTTEPEKISSENGGEEVPVEDIPADVEPTVEEVPEGSELEASLSDGDVGYGDSYNQLDRALDSVDSANSDIDDLTNLGEQIEDSVAEGNTISPIAAESISIMLARLNKNYGFDTKDVVASFAKENFRYSYCAQDNTTISMEGFKDSMKKIVEWIVNSVKKVWEFFWNFAEKAIDKIGKTKAMIPGMKEKIKALKEESSNKNFVFPANVAPHFNYNGATPEIKTIFSMGEEHVKASETSMKISEMAVASVENTYKYRKDGSEGVITTIWNNSAFAKESTFKLGEEKASLYGGRYGTVTLAAGENGINADIKFITKDNKEAEVFIAMPSKVDIMKLSEMVETILEGTEKMIKTIKEHSEKIKKFVNESDKLLRQTASTDEERQGEREARALSKVFISFGTIGPKVDKEVIDANTGFGQGVIKLVSEICKQYGEVPEAKPEEGKKEPEKKSGEVKPIA